jgi:uncharacterized protein YjdB
MVNFLQSVATHTTDMDGHYYAKLKPGVHQMKIQWKVQPGNMILVCPFTSFSQITLKNIVILYTVDNVTDYYLQSVHAC